MPKVERWQAERINRTIGRSLRYLTLLRERMEAVGFVPNDKLMQLVSKAQDAVQHLWIETLLVMPRRCREAAGVGAWLAMRKRPRCWRWVAALLSCWDLRDSADLAHPSSVITRDNFNRIKVGMTEAELQEILGGPPGIYTDRPFVWAMARS